MYYRLLCGNNDHWTVLLHEHKDVELYRLTTRHGTPCPEVVVVLAPHRTRLRAKLNTRGFLEVL